ncbi:MAG: PD40 domain-containing protein [Bacteroidales bacterium]|nr:PD40 domain-containing protein [Bacteroidales bacterium]
MKNSAFFAACLLFLSATFQVSAQSPAQSSTSTTAADGTALWIRNNAISPDGQQIAFSYQGDIWTVGVHGGTARRITSDPSYDGNPLWTRDSRQIVFSSYREGSKDIFIVAAEGGTPLRLTDHPRGETPLAVTAGGEVLFSGSIFTDSRYSEFPGRAQICITDLGGKVPELLTPTVMSALTVNSEGVILYEDYKGYEDQFRKHHTSSVTRDIWMYAPATQTKGLQVSAEGTFTKLSDFEGEDRNPVFASDGKTYYWLSEKSGSFNVWKSSIEEPSKAVQLTAFTDNPVRYLSVADNGMMSFSYNGELYTLEEGGSPQKLEVKVSKDAYRKGKSYWSIAGVSDMAVSPDGKEVAFVSRGDVYVTHVDNEATHRITSTPEQERGVSFSSDGRTLFYASERNGHWGIWKTSLTEKSDKFFSYSFKMKEEPVSTSGETCFQVKAAPKGDKIAYLRNRTELVVKDLSNGKETSLHKDVNYSYTDGDQHFEWSPDGRYILGNWIAEGGWNNSDIAMFDVEKGTITNLTRSGYSDDSFRWALGGKAMTWTTDKQGYRSHGSWGATKDIYLMFFDTKAYSDFLLDKEQEARNKVLISGDKKAEKKEQKDSVKAEKVYEPLLEGREDRIVRLTPSSMRAGSYFLTADGTKLYYIQALEKGMDLCLMNIKDRSIRVIEKNVSGSIHPAADGSAFFMLNGSGISRYDANSGMARRISFSGEYEYDPYAEREYIFNHIWKQMGEKFYDETMRGMDWQSYHDNYAKFLPYIDNGFDFTELLSEMLGEVNGSHTGARFSAVPSLNMACFGVLYDLSYSGEGLKIAEILPGSVLLAADPEIKPGDVILAIDGKEIKGERKFYEFFTRKAGKRVLLTIGHKGGKDRADIYLTASGSDGDGLYRRWVRTREQLVEKLSGGRIGYVHVKGMDSESFREVYSNALGKYRSCDALIVDTRHNGGGWLHDDLATFLSGEKYIDFMPRGQYIGSDPYNKWTKPSCVLIGEDNYSDASGFPYTYRTLGIGKLIGQPVPGTMTAVWWERQINSDYVFGIPQVTTMGIKEGRPLENLQIEPDIMVLNDPASLLRGEDKQVEAAVAEMLRQLANNQ